MKVRSMKNEVEENPLLSVVKILIDISLTLEKVSLSTVSLILLECGLQNFIVHILSQNVTKTFFK